MWIPAGRDAGGLALFSLCIAYGQATEEIRVLRRQKKKKRLTVVVFGAQVQVQVGEAAYT
jgi:hypothetical protein